MAKIYGDIRSIDSFDKKIEKQAVLQDKTTLG